MTDDLVGRLRAALIEAGREAGAFLADDVSDDFLLYVPGEVKGRIAKLTARIEALEGEKVLFRRVFEHLDQGRGPGHCHTIPGIWDDDSSNRDKAGTPCEWCALWSETRAALAKDKSDG